MTVSSPRAFPFLALTILCIAFPGFASLKAVLIAGLWTYLVITQPFRRDSAIWFTSVLLNLALWCLVAMTQWVALPDAVAHLSRLVIFFLVLSIGAFYLTSHGVVDERPLDRLILTTAISTMLLKIAILGVVFLGWMTFDGIQSALGFETTTDSIGVNLQRLQFPSDIAVIFLLSAYVGGRSRIADVLLQASIAIIVFLSFSRFLFGCFVLCLLIRAVWIRRVDIMLGSALVVFAAVAPLIMVSLTDRFFSESTAASDDIRTQQMAVLSDHIARHPVVGTGVGSSAGGYLRSQSQPYFYEVQWYAMAMQFGVIGLTWLALNFVAYLAGVLRNGRDRFLFAIVLAVWLGSGFTNPFLTGLGSAFGICILVLRCQSRARAEAVDADLLTTSRLA